MAYEIGLRVQAWIDDRDNIGFVKPTMFDDLKWSDAIYGFGAGCVLMMIVTTPGMFHFLRFKIGAFEAGFYPGILLYLTY